MSRCFAFDFLKWFYPGMHIKRWLLLIIIGVAIMTFGLSYVVREVYLSGSRLPGFVYYVTLQFIPVYVRGAMYMCGAVGLILFSIWKLNQSLISVIAPNRDATKASSTRSTRSVSCAAAPRSSRSAADTASRRCYAD